MWLLIACHVLDRPVGACSVTAAGRPGTAHRGQQSAGGPEREQGAGDTA